MPGNSQHSVRPSVIFTFFEINQTCGFFISEFRNMQRHKAEGMSLVSPDKIN